MRVSTLSAVCAAALVLPASAAPLAQTTKVVLPIVGATMTLELYGPSEIPNLPVSDAPAPPLPTGRNLQADHLSKSKLPKLARAADFRQADYGVNPNVTFAQVPVQGAEAAPSAAASAPAGALRRRSDDDWEAARLKPDYDYSAVDSASSGDLSDPSAAPDPAPSVPPSAPGLAPAAPVTSGPPLKFGNLQDANAGDLPVSPDLSAVSQAAGKGVQTTGDTRYRAAYASHDTLGAVFAQAKPAMVSSHAVEKAPAQLGKGDAAHGLPLLRRVLHPASYIAALYRRSGDLLASLARGGGSGNGMGAKSFKEVPKSFNLKGHDVQLSTEPLIPSRPDPTLNMSDPYVAQEEARRQHVGVLNVDSNHPAPPPPPAPLADVPLNGTATNSTAAAVDGGLKDGEEGAQSVQVDKAAKNATEAA
ncbi:hypothetical protein BD414DRAFT_482947 [Trametes punicea]|nr:hypothetical protein BD414DRAFT_482947 [Trametes punicea]